MGEKLLDVRWEKSEESPQEKQYTTWINNKVPSTLTTDAVQDHFHHCPHPPPIKHSPSLSVTDQEYF